MLWTHSSLLALGGCGDLFGQYEGDQTGECANGADEDRDGLIDCADSDCVTYTGCAELSDSGTGADTSGDTGAGDTGDSEGTAPTLDEFLHSAWTGYSAENLAGIGEKTVLIDATLNGDEFALVGNFSDITAAELALVELGWAPDAAAATGFYVVDTIGCTAAQLETVLTSLEQDEIYHSYTAYERNYTSDGDAFFAGEADFLHWETTYSVDVFVGQYTMSTVGGVQRLNGYFDDPIYVTRTFAPNPADSSSEDLHFEQDYQIGVFFPRDGTYVHTYAMWRQFGTTADGDQDDPLIHDIIINAMEDYFENTTEFCSTM